MFYMDAKPKQYNQYRFICDYKSDIEQLPTLTNKVQGFSTPRPGSTAFVIEDTLCYVYGGDNEWHEI